MSAPTYTARAIVLRKTKLGEADLILPMLAEDGSQLRAVAKGARKPKSSFASRLELYAVADILCSKGRSLDIVKEARLVDSNDRLRRDIEHAAAAAPMAELVGRVAQTGLENPKLFACTRAAFATMGTLDAPATPGICAAHLLKAFAFSGFRPSLRACAVCSAPVDTSARGVGEGAAIEDAGATNGLSAAAEVESGADGFAAHGTSLRQCSSTPGHLVGFSCREGGVVCDSCRPQTEAVLLPAQTVAWMCYLMGATFGEVAASGVDTGAAFSVLHVCQQWSREHVGANLKSLEFLFTCGLF